MMLPLMCMFLTFYCIHHLTDACLNILFNYDVRIKLQSVLCHLLLTFCCCKIAHRHESVVASATIDLHVRRP
jgi:hypothetical protein